MNVLLWVTVKWYFDNHFVTFILRRLFKTTLLSCQSTTQLKWMYCTHPWGLKRALSLSVWKTQKCSLVSALEIHWVWFVSLGGAGSIFVGKQLAFISASETRALTDIPPPPPQPTLKISFTLCEWHERISLSLLVFRSLSLSHTHTHTHTQIHTS